MSWGVQILLLIKDVLYCIILNMNLKWCRVLEPIKVFYVLLCKWKKKNNQSWKNLSRDLFKFYMCHFLCLQQMKNIWFLHCTYNHHHYIDLVLFSWGRGTVIKFIFLKLFQALIFNFIKLKQAWRGHSQWKAQLRHVPPTFCVIRTKETISVSTITL